MDYHLWIGFVTLDPNLTFESLGWYNSIPCALPQETEQAALLLSCLEKVMMLVGKLLFR